MLSADGGRVAFATWQDGRNVVVVNGEFGEPFDFVTWPPAMSDRGDIAYAARRGSEQFCVVGSRPGPAYRTVHAPVMTRHGSVVAFSAEDGQGAFAVLGGSRGPDFEWVGHVAVSADGRRLAYAAEGADRRFRVVVDDRPGPSFDRVTRPVFSGDGRTAAYGARENGAWFVVEGERRLGAPGEVVSVFLSDDGRCLGGVVEERRRFRIVTQAGLSEAYDWIGWPAFAPDGRAYWFASRGETKLLVCGGREVDLGDCILWSPELQSDGTTVAFSARHNRELWRRATTLP